MTDTFISIEEEFERLVGTEQVLGDSQGEPAYLYIRSSSKLQAQEGRESLSRQLLFGHEKALQDGRYIPVDMAYWDIWRGKDADRPEFLRLLSDVRQHKRSDLIYIDQTDRLSRNTAVYYVLLHDLIRHGLSVRFESEEDELVRHIKLAFDEIELERRSYRQIQANRARATKGYITARFASFGYDLTKDKRSYVINQEQAYWVQRIFDWYTAGRSMRWIAKALNEHGLAPPRGGKTWQPQSIRKMLNNTVYKGTYIANRREQFWVWEAGKQKLVNRLKPEEEWIHVPVPSIVSEEKWDAAQELLSQNKRLSLRNGQKNEWLLSQLLRCVCGHLYSAYQHRQTKQLASGERKTYEWGVYRCSDMHRVAQDSCNSKRISKNKIEPMILEALEQLISNVELWDTILDNKDDQNDRLQEHVVVYQKKIREIDAQLEELLQLVLAQRTATVRKLFLEKQGELEKQRSDFERQLNIAQERLDLAHQNANRREVAEAILADLRKLGGLSSLPFDEQRRLLTLLVDEIVLDTREQWFEIRGELNERFSYVSGDIVSTSGYSGSWPK
ncbi:MAG: recombinase family protein, partial [Caldilineaceae bacterium]|nr:recombinase family protein [Caldilineaceae bacterium]